VGCLLWAGSIDLTGIEDKVNWDEMFTLPKDYWQSDIRETIEFLDTEVGDDLPPRLRQELNEQEERIKKM